MRRFLIRPWEQARRMNSVLCAAILLGLLLLPAAPAQACSVSATTPANFGQSGSMNVYDGVLKTSSNATGITCVTALSVLDNSYIGLEVVGPIAPLKHEDFADTIPLSLSWTSDGPDLSTNTLHLGNSATILGLLHTTGGRITLHFRTKATNAIRAGNYFTTVKLKWYYSVCLVGALGAVCLAPTNSPNLERTCFLICGSISDWGTGTEVLINVQLVVKKDCAVTATAVEFGTAPLPERFPTISNSVNVRCTAGEAYTVGLNNGQNHDGSNRQMRHQINNDLMAYDIWKYAAGEERWGDTSTERRSSDSAPPPANGSTTQNFTYRAEIRKTQATGTAQRAGVYKDTLRVSVEF